jgi:hypothetical protein
VFAVFCFAHAVWTFVARRRSRRKHRILVSASHFL